MTIFGIGSSDSHLVHQGRPDMSLVDWRRLSPRANAAEIVWATSSSTSQ